MCAVERPPVSQGAVEGSAAAMPPAPRVIPAWSRDVKAVSPSGKQRIGRKPWTLWNPAQSRKPSAIRRGVAIVMALTMGATAVNSLKRNPPVKPGVLHMRAKPYVTSMRVPPRKYGLPAAKALLLATRERV